MCFDDGKGQSQESELEQGLALLGLYVEGGISLDSDEFCLWPENDEAFTFWMSVQTQWHYAMAGPTGLNYPGVEVCMRRRGVPARDRNHLFGMVQAMERAALEEWANARS